jgi:hypothetical protein
VIEFLCPNGHRIRCQPEQAGRPAKCPRCGVKFRIPNPTDQNVSITDSSDSKFPRPEFIESTGSSRKLPAAGGISQGGKQKKEQIEFLCPNGHRLHGSVHLLGKPGQCPECGSRFRIPTHEEIVAAEQTEQEINLAHVDIRGKPDAVNRSVAETQRSLPNPQLAGEPTAVASQIATSEGMAAMVGRLWEMRSNGATLEIRLRNGETIVPDQFLKQLSQQNHVGAFAIKDSTGQYALVAVAWDSIVSAAILGLHELPSDA